jgi:hypothetical protein
MTNIAGEAVSTHDERAGSGHRSADPGADRHVKDVPSFLAHAEALLAEGHCLDVVQDGDAKRSQLL